VFFYWPEAVPRNVHFWPISAGADRQLHHWQQSADCAEKVDDGFYGIKVRA
jgi:hypothetical protein